MISYRVISYRKLRSLLFLSVFIILAAASVKADGFSLEQILSAPFPSELITAPKGDKAAWVFDSQGKRNIWIAEAPDFKSRQLTRYDRDDGQDLTGLVFSPDGRWIAYVRGGEANSNGDVPNPASDPTGARQEVWVVNTRTGAALSLVEGEQPLFSPACDAVLFNRNGSLWTVPVGGGHEKKLFEIRGSVTSAVWSPDGSQLAFVSQRDDHSFITLYDVRSSRLRFIQPSIDRDTAPRWSPDGRRIAFLRLFNVPDTYSADRERMIPWSIWIADVESGSARQAWKSGASEVDSFSQVFGEDVLQWAAGDRLVFGSEMDGWAHLYAIPSSGGQATLLTPGNYEVENVAWSSDRSFAVIASNAGDIDRRHLWRVGIDGGSPRAVTSGNNIELSPQVVGSDRQIVYFRSSAREPLLPYISAIDGSGARPLAVQSLLPDFPASKLVEPEQVIFTAADGLEIHGQLFKPGGSQGRLPAVVFMHGGPIRQMLLGWHYLFYYHNSYALNQYLASRGFIVLSVNFRSGIGYGRAFREAKRRGARGAAEYQDVVAAGKYLQSRPDVNPGKIGLWGGSYGGFLTGLGLARNSDLFAAGVDIHGVHDWSARAGRGGASAELVRLARDSSPIAAADRWKSPVLFIHGDDDRNVAFSQTVDLARRLRERGVEFEQLVLPDEIHDFLLHRSWLRIYKAASEFLERRLK